LIQRNGLSDLPAASEEELTKLTLTLRDFASLLQLIGRVSSLFASEDDYLQRLLEGSALVRELIELAAYGGRMRFYNLPTARTNSKLARGFLEVQAHTLAALKSWCHWLHKLHTASNANQKYQNECSELTSKVTVAAVIVVKEGGEQRPCTSQAIHSTYAHAGQREESQDASSPHGKLLHSAVHFLVTLTGTVRPPSIWKLKDFTDLYSGLSNLRLPPEDARLLVRSLANVLLLQWPCIADQRWEERKKHLTKFLGDITVAFRAYRQMDDFANSRALQTEGNELIQFVSIKSPFV